MIKYLTLAYLSISSLACSSYNKEVSSPYSSDEDLTPLFGKWMELYRCDAGKMVIDRALKSVDGPYHREYDYQVVIRDADSIKHFTDAGLKSTVPDNEDEFIVKPMYRTEWRNSNFLATQGLEVNYLVYPQDDGYVLEADRVNVKMHFIGCEYMNPKG